VRCGHLDVVANFDNVNPTFNPPTSLEAIDNTVYIATIQTVVTPGAIWKGDNLAGPPHDPARRR